MEIKRGQIYYADISGVRGSEQGGLRPVLILQNDIGNKYAPTTIIAPITSKLGKHKIPTHCEIRALKVESLVLLEQVRVIDKSRLKDYMCVLDKADMERVNKALKVSVGL